MNKIRVMVVDDEPLILRSIKRSIEEGHPEFIVVAEAMNGEDALPIIEQTLPDVLFTDIRTPIMDGLSLVAELRRRNHDVRVVIISGYQDFEYAKNVLKLGVEEYLLKPVDQNELKELLLKIHQSHVESKVKKQYEWMYNLLHQEDYSPSIANHHLFEEYVYFDSMLICSGSYTTFNSNWITPQLDFWLKLDLPALLSEHLPETSDYWILEPNNNNEKWIIIGNKQSSSELQNPFSSISKSIYDALVQKQFPITLVESKPFDSVTDLPYVLQRIKINQHKFSRFAQSSRIDSNQPSDICHKFDSLMDPYLERRMIMFIESNQCQPFKAEFTKLLDEYENKLAPQFWLKSMLKHLIKLFQGHCHHLSQNRLIEIEMEIDELISNSYKYSSIHSGMSLIIDELFRSKKTQDLQKHDSTLLVENVKSTLRQNFCNQISLQSVAENYGLSLPYLSSVFKKQIGMSPMEYILHLRIELAKELLTNEPHLSIKDISLSIGYEDPYYMSRIFKTMTGKSPTEFKKELKKD